MIESRDVIEFWLGDPDSAYYPNERMGLWFGKDETVDAEITARFGDAVLAAGKGRLDDWAETPRGRLALIILIDQFTRNIYRGSGEMYRFDHHALAMSLTGLERGDHKGLHLFERLFMYLPLEHSEDREHQARCVSIFESELEAAPEEQKGLAKNLLDYAIKHRVIVDRFGRFPHRNVLLGRASTPEETEFLAEEGSSF